MQRQSNANEQKVVDEKIITNRFLTVNPPEQGSPLGKTTPFFRGKTNRVNVYPELKRTDALSSVPIDDCDDVLKIRSFRQSKPACEDDAKLKIITINVSGGRFQTYLSTLELYPDTLLGNEQKRKFYWNPDTEEYFFDRHRACFEAILYYYQSQGCIRRPGIVPIDTFLEEITFFELGSEAYAQVHQAENIKEIHRKPMPRTLWRRYIWFFIEYPQYSVVARIINVTSMLFTILSCVSLAIETLPQYNNYWDNICKLEANMSLNSTDVPRCSALFQSPFFIIQTVCVTYFTIEFTLRLISTPSYCRFLFSFYNWIDLGAIIPYYVTLAIQLASQDIGINTIATLSLRILRVLRFSRLFKIYTVFRQLKSLRVLSATVKESLVDFAVMIVILTLLAFLFGAATYLAEQEVNGEMFDSIPAATYFGIITITGVGYGDMYPVTTAGRIITCLCALSGAATMGMLVSVLVDRYQRVYNRKMYLNESETTPVDLETINHLDEDDTNSLFSVHRSSGRGGLSGVMARRASLFPLKIRHDHRPSSSASLPASNLQFVVSFNSNNNKDHDATDHIVTVMKKKLTEAISTTNIDVKLKLVDDEKREIWTISSADSSMFSTSNTTVSTNIVDHQVPKIHAF